MIKWNFPHTFRIRLIIMNNMDNIFLNSQSYRSLKECVDWRNMTRRHRRKESLLLDQFHISTSSPFSVSLI